MTDNVGATDSTKDTPRVDIRTSVILSYVIGIILVLTIGVVALGQLRRIGTTVNTLTEELATNRALAQQIVNDVLLARFYVHAYVRTEAQTDADRFTASYEQLSQDLAQARDQITTPERTEKLDRIEAAVQRYGETFDAATQLVRRRQRLVNEVLYMQVQSMDLKLTGLRVHIATMQGAPAFLAFGNAQEAVHDLELSATTYADTGDEGAAVRFESAVTAAQEAFLTLRGQLSDPFQQLNVDQALSAVEGYRTGFDEIHATTQELNELLDLILNDIEPEINGMAADIVASIDREFETKRQASQTQLQRAQVSLVVTTATVVVTGFFLVGLTFRRMSEREAGERALRNSEERYRTLFEGVPVGLYRSRPNGDLMDANPALVATLGYEKRETLLAIPAHRHYVDPADRERWLQQMEGEGVVRNFEARVRQKDGTIVWARENAHVVRAHTGHPAAGEVLYYEGSMEDISDQKAADAALRAARDELEQKVQQRTAELMLANAALRSEINQRKGAEAALKDYSVRLEDMVDQRTEELAAAQEALIRREKLALLGQLAGGVGHDLRNPLGVIANAVYFLRMVLEGAQDPIGDYLEIIDHEVANAEKIVADLLDFARVKSANRLPIAVAPLVNETLTKCPAAPGIARELTLPPDLPEILVDGQQIERVLINVVTNAYEAMGKDGTLSIVATPVNGDVTIAVSDTGYGISSEDLERIFEPLFTTKPGGIGLGLAISRNLVEANHGSITVRSAPDEGTTFTLRFAAAPEGGDPESGGKDPAGDRADL